MRLFETFTKYTMSLFPLKYGHDKLRHYLAPVPNNVDPLSLTTLRGYPIKMYYNPKTYMGWMLFYRGIYEEEQLKTCYMFLEEGMTFVDIGANYGLYSLIASKKAGETGRVIAFEPQRKLISIIGESVSENHFTNVTVVHSAIGDGKKFLTLFHPSTSNDGQATLALGIGEKSFGEENVPVDRLENLLKHHKVGHVHGAKIDVEGAEFIILQNAEPYFANAEPYFLFIECIEDHLNRFGHSCQDVFAFLQDYGYRLASSYRGRWVTFTNCAEFKDKAHSSSDVVAVHPSTEVWKKARRLFR